MKDIYYFLRIVLI